MTLGTIDACECTLCWRLAPAERPLTAVNLSLTLAFALLAMGRKPASKRFFYTRGLAPVPMVSHVRPSHLVNQTS